MRTLIAMRVTLGHSTHASRLVLEIEFDQHSRFGAHHPALVARLDNHDLRRSELRDAAVRVLNMDLTVGEEPDVGVHAEIGSYDGFDVGRPAESGRVNHTLDAGRAGSGDVELDAGNLLVLGSLHRSKERVGSAHNNVLQRRAGIKDSKRQNRGRGAITWRRDSPTAAFDLNRARRCWRQVGEQLTFAWALELLARHAMAGQVKIIEHQLALEKLDGFGRIDALGARARALARIVTAESASRSRCDRVAFAAAFVARVLVVALRRGQRHWAEIARVSCQGRAGSHAASALDAVAELQISLEFFRRLIEFSVRIVDVSFIAAKDIWLYRAMFVEHRHQIWNQIADDVEIRQRADAEVGIGYVQNLRVAGECRTPIEQHAA